MTILYVEATQLIDAMQVVMFLYCERIAELITIYHDQFGDNAEYTTKPASNHDSMRRPKLILFLL